MADKNYVDLPEDISPPPSLKTTPLKKEELLKRLGEDAHVASSFLPIDVLKAYDLYNTQGAGAAAKSIAEDVGISLAGEGMGKAFIAGAKLAAPAIKTAAIKGAPALASVIPVAVLDTAKYVKTPGSKARIMTEKGAMLAEDLMDTAGQSRQKAAEILRKAGTPEDLIEQSVLAAEKKAMQINQLKQNKSNLERQRQLLDEAWDKASDSNNHRKVDSIRKELEDVDKQIEQINTAIETIRR